MKDIKIMKKHRSCVLRLLITIVFFSFVAPRILSGDSGEQTSRQIYILIGQIEKCIHVDWRDISTPRESEITTLPDGKMRLSIAVKMPFLHMARVLGNCDIFVITDNEATKVDIEKQIVLMQDTRRGFMTEKKYREVLKRLLTLDKRLLYYASLYDVPEELIKKYGLEQSVIFQEQEKKLPVMEGTREFGLELRKLGITLSRSETNAVSQNPSHTRNDLLKADVDDMIRLNGAAQE